MGGAVVTRASGSLMAKRYHVGGIAVLDIVEGTFIVVRTWAWKGRSALKTSTQALLLKHFLTCIDFSSPDQQASLQ